MTNLTLSQPEVWKQIDGFGGRYEISNKGRVLSKFVSIQKKPYGITPSYEYCLKAGLAGWEGKRYLSVVLQVNKFRKSIKVHRLVALYFIPNPENKPQINHIDGNKLNNDASNLEWCTNRENQDHAARIGLRTKYGVDHGRSAIYLHQETGIFYNIKEVAELLNIKYHHVWYWNKIGVLKNFARV